MNRQAKNDRRASFAPKARNRKKVVGKRSTKNDRSSLARFFCPSLAYHFLAGTGGVSFFGGHIKTDLNGLTAAAGGRKAPKARQAGKRLFNRLDEDADRKNCRYKSTPLLFLSERGDTEQLRLVVI